MAGFWAVLGVSQGCTGDLSVSGMAEACGIESECRHLSDLAEFESWQRHLARTGQKGRCGLRFRPKKCQNAGSLPLCRKSPKSVM